MIIVVAFLFAVASGIDPPEPTGGRLLESARAASFGRTKSIECRYEGKTVLFRDDGEKALNADVRFEGLFRAHAAGAVSHDVTTIDKGRIALSWRRGAPGRSQGWGPAGDLQHQVIHTEFWATARPQHGLGQYWAGSLLMAIPKPLWQRAERLGHETIDGARCEVVAFPMSIEPNFSWRDGGQRWCIDMDRGGNALLIEHWQAGEVVERISHVELLQVNDSSTWIPRSVLHETCCKVVRDEKLGSTKIVRNARPVRATTLSILPETLRVDEISSPAEVDLTFIKGKPVRDDAAADLEREAEEAKRRLSERSPSRGDPSSPK